MQEVTEQVELAGITFDVTYEWENPADHGAYNSGDVGCIGRGWNPGEPYLVVTQVYYGDQDWTHMLSKWAMADLVEAIKSKKGD